MIEELKRTYELFPKHEKEEDRTLYVTNYFRDGYEVRLVIYINGIKHTSGQLVSENEYAAFKSDYNDVLIYRLCRYFIDQFSDDDK